MYRVIGAGTILWQTNLYRAKDTVRARHQIDSLAEGAKVIPSFCGDAIHPSGQQDLGVDHVIRGREFQEAEAGHVDLHRLDLAVVQWSCEEMKVSGRAAVVTEVHGSQIG